MSTDIPVFEIIINISSSGPTVELLVKIALFYINVL